MILSSDLYENANMTSFDLANGYTLLVVNGPSSHVPAEIIDSRIKLQAKRKLSAISKSKALTETDISSAVMVQLCTEGLAWKMARWSIQKHFLLIDEESQTVADPRSRLNTSKRGY